MVTFCACLNLIGIGSTQTIIAIFNITAPALDLSYIAVIIAHRVYENRVQFIEGPYTMGKWSKPVNYVAIVWVIFISVVLFFPPIRPVTPANMNYAICVAAIIALFSLGWWWTGARKYAFGLSSCISSVVRYRANRVLCDAGNTPVPAQNPFSTSYPRRIPTTSYRGTRSPAAGASCARCMSTQSKAFLSSLSALKDVARFVRSD